MEISFRPMVTDDLLTISCWQSKPEVRQWFGKEYISRNEIENHYQEELEEMPRLTWHLQYKIYCFYVM